MVSINSELLANFVALQIVVPAVLSVSLIVYLQRKTGKFRKILIVPGILVGIIFTLFCVVTGYSRLTSPILLLSHRITTVNATFKAVASGESGYEINLLLEDGQRVNLWYNGDKCGMFNVHCFKSTSTTYKRLEEAQEKQEEITFVYTDVDEAPSGIRPGYLLPVASSGAESLRSESSSLSSPSLRSWFFAKEDKILLRLESESGEIIWQIYKYKH